MPKNCCAQWASYLRLTTARSSFYDLLQHVPIQRQIGHQSLELGVLLAQLPQLPHLERAQFA
jgi:hypothetical protein